MAGRLLEFWQFFRGHPTGARQALSVRDLLAWADFISRAAPKIGSLPAYAHGAHLVLLDGIGLGIGMQAQVFKFVLTRHLATEKLNFPVASSVQILHILEVTFGREGGPRDMASLLVLHHNQETENVFVVGMLLGWYVEIHTFMTSH